MAATLAGLSLAADAASGMVRILRGIEINPLAAYGWPEDIATEDALAALLALDLQRAAAGR